MFCANLNWKLKIMEIEKRLTFDGIVSGGFIIQSTKSDLIEGRKKHKTMENRKLQYVWSFGSGYIRHKRASAIWIDTHWREKKTDKPNYQSQYWTVFFPFCVLCCVVLKGKRINSLCNYGTKIVSFQHFSMLHRHISGSFYLKKNWFWLPNWNNHDFR